MSSLVPPLHRQPFHLDGKEVSSGSCGDFFSHFCGIAGQGIVNHQCLAAFLQGRPLFPIIFAVESLVVRFGRSRSLQQPRSAAIGKIQEIPW